MCFHLFRWKSSAAWFTSLSSLFPSSCASCCPFQVEDCIDLTLEPKPVGYGASRRMARRFDETLIVEVEVVDTKENNGRIF